MQNGESRRLRAADNGAGLYTYENFNFFPIDGQLYGNGGNSHNYYFTYQIATKSQTCLIQATSFTQPRVERGFFLPTARFKES